MHFVNCAKRALTRSISQPQMHQMSFGGRVPPGPARELRHSLDYLAVGEETGLNKWMEERGRGEGGEGGDKVKGEKKGGCCAGRTHRVIKCRHCEGTNPFCRPCPCPIRPNRRSENPLLGLCELWLAPRAKTTGNGKKRHLPAGRFVTHKCLGRAVGLSSRSFTVQSTSTDVKKNKMLSSRRETALQGAL